MSHYLVGVVVDDIKNVDINDTISEILAPYDENMSVKPYIYKTKDKIIKEARKNKLLYLSDKIKYKYFQHYVKCISDDDYYNEYVNSYDYEFDENGNELSTYNPDSKWDWWQIVGDRCGNTYIKIKDFVLYDKLDNIKREKLEREWKYYNNELNITQEQAEKEGFDTFFKKEFYVNRYKTLGLFIKDYISNIPYAFVDKNGWYERGQVGWFGCDDATNSSIESYLKFAECYFTDKTNLEKYMVFVDCHI